ncbi:hypothetical protein [Apis mellifera associated microvirus 54]|nr:hypothetical protein [Apis mellifera associated microvirus 54]
MSRREQVSDQPITASLKFKHKQVDTLSELMQRLSMVAKEKEYETLEEADDFNIGDDYDPSSPWEEQFDPQGESLGFLATGIKKPPQGGEPQAKEGENPPAEPSIDKNDL